MQKLTTSTQLHDLYKQVRTELGISQTEMAKRLNISPKTISDIENYRTKNLNIEILIARLDVLGYEIFVYLRKLPQDYLIKKVKLKKMKEIIENLEAQVKSLQKESTVAGRSEKGRKLNITITLLETVILRAKDAAATIS